jgi:hypothetical protein
MTGKSLPCSVFLEGEYDLTSADSSGRLGGIGAVDDTRYRVSL